MGSAPSPVSYSRIGIKKKAPSGTSSPCLQPESPDRHLLSSSPMNLRCISPPGSSRMNRKRPKKTEFPFCKPHFKTAFNLPCDPLNINQALTQFQQMGQRTVGPFISARETHRFPGLTKFPVFIYFLKPCIIEPQNH